MKNHTDTSKKKWNAFFLYVCFTFFCLTKFAILKRKKKNTLTLSPTATNGLYPTGRFDRSHYQIATFIGEAGGRGGVRDFESEGFDGEGVFSRFFFLQTKGKQWLCQIFFKKDFV